MGRRHGRNPRRKISRSRRRAIKGRDALIGRDVLEDVWEGGQCAHPEPAMSMYGLCASLICPDCGIHMMFLLKFGRPKAFSVLINDGVDRPVGRTSVKDAVEFLLGTAVNIYMPEGGVDSEGGHVNYDMYRLEILMDVLYNDGGPTTDPPPTVDFEGPWRGIDCQHEHTLCQVYSDFIELECTDCAAVLTFDLADAGRFDVSMSRAPLPPTMYGLHGADTVIDIIREYAETLDLPNKMADKMSDDPDRDARNIASLVLLLEQSGLLSRVKVDRSERYDMMVEHMSAMLHTRSEFVSFARVLGDTMRSEGVKFQEHGRVADTQRGLEAVWLSWPFWFNGIGVDITPYDPDGQSEYCVRCGFSTLDDTAAGPDHWKRGCPECGYAGYLLDMDSGQAKPTPRKRASSRRR